MAAKLAEPSGGRLVEQSVIGYLDDGVSPAALITGLMNLSTLLLVRLERLSDRDPLEELQAIDWAVRTAAW
jgi:hypothetical protein